MKTKPRRPYAAQSAELCPEGCWFVHACFAPAGAGTAAVWLLPVHLVQLQKCFVTEHSHLTHCVTVSHIEH